MLMRPYRGALTASLRSADYLRFLRVDPRRIRLGYDAISLERIRVAAGTADGAAAAFDDRYFLVVARLVPKKNHPSCSTPTPFTRVRPHGRADLCCVAPVRWRTPFARK